MQLVVLISQRKTTASPVFSIMVYLWKLTTDFWTTDFWTPSCMLTIIVTSYIKLCLYVRTFKIFLAKVLQAWHFLLLNRLLLIPHSDSDVISWKYRLR
jgi:hypothetical protein